MFDVSQQFLIYAFGLFFIVRGLSAHLGFWKSWYWRSQRSIVYGYAILGLLFIAAGNEDFLIKMLGGNENLLWIVYGAILLAAVGVGYFTPSFLKPRWIRQIEAEHPYIYKAMAAAVKDGEMWENHIKDEETLKKWIRSLRRKKK
jgi:hypothetical protein